MPAKKGKKTRKYGRNKTFCEKYEREGRRIKNKIKKLHRHLRAYPEDKQAAKRLRYYEQGI